MKLRIFSILVLLCASILSTTAQKVADGIRYVGNRISILEQLNKYRDIIEEDYLRIIDSLIVANVISANRNNYKQDVRDKEKDENMTYNVIELIRHPVNPYFYGVTLHLLRNASTYENSGYVTLLIEMRDNKSPIIHYRIWQPESISSHTLTKEEIVNIMNFNIPSLD